MATEKGAALVVGKSGWKVVEEAKTCLNQGLSVEQGEWDV